jgi:hypothetical protein
MRLHEIADASEYLLTGSQIEELLPAVGSTRLGATRCCCGIECGLPDMPPDPCPTRKSSHL